MSYYSSDSFQESWSEREQQASRQSYIRYVNISFLFRAHSISKQLMVLLSPTDNESKATQKGGSLYYGQNPLLNNHQSTTESTKRNQAYYISFLISSVWLLLSTNQLDLKTWIEHNITSVPNAPQRRQKKKNRLFLLLHPSAARRFQSVPPPLSIKTSKSVSIYYQRGKKKVYLEEDGEPRERGGARLADGAGEASGGEVRRRADVALLLMFYCYLSPFDFGL